MPNRTIGIALIVVGILLILVSLLADFIGVGAQPGIIGWKQILGTCAGAVMGILGIFLVRRT